jgi:hypothetical protein
MAPVHYVTNQEWETIQGYWSKEQVRGNKPLYWEDVQVGDQLVPGVDGPFRQIQVGAPIMPPPGDDGELPDLDDLPPMPMQDPNETYDRKDYQNIRHQMADPETFAKMVRSELDGCYYLPEELPKPERKRSIIMNFHARDTAFRTISNWYGDHGTITNIKWRIMRKTPATTHRSIPMTLRASWQTCLWRRIQIWTTGTTISSTGWNTTGLSPKAM